MKLAVGAEAVTRFNDLRRSGELELLLITPLRPGFITRGMMLAMKRQFEAPIVLVLAIDAVILLFGGRWCRGLDAGFVERLSGLVNTDVPIFLLRDLDQTIRALILWSTMVLLVLDLRALAWNGLWLGLRSTTVAKALRLTLYRVLVEPSVLFLMTLPLAPTLWICGLAAPAPEGWLLGGVVWWLVIGIGCSFALAIRARRRLDLGLREGATIRFGR